MRCIDHSCANVTYPELGLYPLLLVSVIGVGGRFVVVPRLGRPLLAFVRDKARVKVPAKKPQHVVGVA